MSKNEQRIDNWCMRENFEPTLVLELTRVLLEHFRSGLKISDMFHPNLTEENLKKQKDTMRRDFLEAIRWIFRTAYFKSFVTARGCDR